MFCCDKKFIGVAGLVLAMALCFPQMVLAGEANEGNDPEIKQILTAAKQYAGPTNPAVAKSELKFVKKVKNYALVEICPKPKYKGQWECAGIILKKIGDTWVGQDLGSDLSNWKGKIPDGLLPEN